MEVRANPKMNINRNAVSSAMIGMAVVMVVVVVASVAYVAVNPGTTKTLTVTTTVQTSSAAPVYYPMTLQAGGSTFVNPVMVAWTNSFYLFTNNVVQTNYQAIGSGAGITGILKGTFEFAGSDAPVPTSQSGNYSAVKGPLLQFPEALGGVAVFYNIPGVTANLNLTGPIVADIYIGNITMWNDPRIQSLNPHVSLPANTIIPVHRSDGSGTTYALTNYFEKVSHDWNASWTNGLISSVGCPCFSTSVNWPSFEISGKGSGGVAAQVQANANSIGYADSYYAFNNGLKAAAIQNQAGHFLVPTLTNIAAAAAAFSTQIQANPTFAITNAPGAGSYPIATYTYILVWQNQTNQQAGADAAQFFWWMIHQGQGIAPSFFYPQLPSGVVTADEAIIQKMNYNGTPLIHS